MKRKMILKKLLRGNRWTALVLLFLVITLTFFLSKSEENKEKLFVDSSSAESGLKEEISKEKPVFSFVETGEMRAVWVPYMTLSMENGEGEKEFRAKFETIAENSKAKGMNALIVQVRPFSDALYPSSFYPWSHILTGEQGKDPGYDPLAIMVEIAHEKGMELHAWVNPLRIATNGTPSNFSEDSVLSHWKADEEKKLWVKEIDSGIYIDPAYEGARNWIIGGVAEIARNYDVDGIQFDDYFYPTSDQSFDAVSYEAYCSAEETPLPLQDWREANISSLIAGVYQAVKKENPQVVFGISPQGNLQNVYSACADVYSWGAVSGYVDYLCPQMYVSLENELLPYEETLRTWRELTCGKDIKLYVGLGVYKAGTDADSGQWQNRDDILSTELQIGRNLSCDGFMFYSYDYLVGEAAKEEVANVMAVLE